jgi:hypothetical protein
MMKRGILLTCLLVVISPLVFSQAIGIFTGQASVGNDAGAGLASFKNDVYEIEAGGSDIWGVPDGFYWIYKEITGDFTATATVQWITSVDEGDEWKKAGIIGRDTADDPIRDDGKYACSALIRSNFSNFFVRPETDSGEADIVDGRNADISNFTNTVQLKRVGNMFSMLRGLKSGGFTEEGTKEIQMSDKILVGLCVTSHDTSTIESADFSDVGITQGTAIPDFSLYE